MGGFGRNRFRRRAREPSNVTVLDDVVWLTSKARSEGNARFVSERLAAADRPDAVLLVAHFPVCLQALQKLADEGRIAGPVAVVSAVDLNGLPAGMTLGESRAVEIVVGERHPLRSHDEAIAEFARSLHCRCRVVHHVSLDDLLMRVFAGEWVQSVLKSLGIAADEPIQSSMVAHRIKAAQDKLAASCRSDFPADSAEEWLERNGPGA